MNWKAWPVVRVFRTLPRMVALSWRIVTWGYGGCGREDLKSLVADPLFRKDFERLEQTYRGEI